MGRREIRLKSVLEKNAAVQCHKIQRKYIPELLDYFSQTADP